MFDWRRLNTEARPPPSLSAGQITEEVTGDTEEEEGKKEEEGEEDKEEK